MNEFWGWPVICTDGISLDQSHIEKHIRFKKIKRVNCIVDDKWLRFEPPQAILNSNHGWDIVSLMSDLAMTTRTIKQKPV